MHKWIKKTDPYYPFFQTIGMETRWICKIVLYLIPFQKTKIQ
jgi:hypothetical protein